MINGRDNNVDDDDNDVWGDLISRERENKIRNLITNKERKTGNS